MASERLHSPGDDVDDEPYTPPALPEDHFDRPNVLAVAFAVSVLTICAVIAIIATGYAIGLARGG